MSDPTGPAAPGDPESAPDGDGAPEVEPETSIRSTADLPIDSDAEVIPVVRRRPVVRAVIAVTAIVVALAFLIRPLVITPPPPPPTPPPSSNAADRIAVIAPDGKLSIVDSTGGSVERFPVDATTFLFPAFSPDGSSLAVIGAGTDDSSVIVFDVGPTSGAAAAAPRAVFSSPDRGVIYLSWSPDGERIAFLTGEPGTLALRVARFDGVGDDLVVTTGQPLYWDWLDPSHLVVHAGGNGAGAFIRELGIDAAPPIERESAPGIFQSPAISADGRFVAYVASGAGGESTLVIDGRDGPRRSALVKLRAASFGWSPANPELAFIDGGGAAGPALGPLRVGDAASGVTRTLLDAAVVAFFWSPDGTSIAALSLEAVDGGSIASAAGFGDGRVAAIPGVAFRLNIVNASSGERSLERLVALGDLFEQQFLPFFDQYAKSHEIWSADSAAVALPLVDAEGASHLTVVPIDGGPEVDLGPGVLGFWSP